MCYLNLECELVERIFEDCYSVLLEEDFYNYLYKISCGINVIGKCLLTKMIYYALEKKLLIRTFFKHRIMKSKSNYLRSDYNRDGVASSIRTVIIHHLILLITESENL